MFIFYVDLHSLAPDIPAEFLSFYGLLNFYLYTLAFVYSPSKNALYGQWWKHGVGIDVSNCCDKVLWLVLLHISDIQLKDNPAFSMLNDSDDEVIYRSVPRYV